MNVIILDMGAVIHYLHAQWHAIYSLVVFSCPIVERRLPHLAPLWSHLGHVLRGDVDHNTNIFVCFQGEKKTKAKMYSEACDNVWFREMQNQFREDIRTQK